MTTTKTTKATKLKPTPAALAIHKQQISEVREGFLNIAEFGAGMTAFFTRANELEVRADNTLAVIRKTAVPTNGSEDERVQLDIKTARADLKETTEHYDTITKVVTRLHRFFTAKRKRTTDPLEESIKLGNNLHNAWTRMENERVERVNAERRRKAEEAERLKNQKRLDALERKALAAEAKSKDLSERETRFVELVIGGVQPMRAAQQVGYQEPFDRAAKLMGTPKIIKAIKAKQEAAALREQQRQIVDAPPATEFVEEKADVRRAAGTRGDRTTWKAVLDDEALLIEAVIAGNLGIPHDVVMVDRVKLNEYARRFQKQIDRWPGCHAESETGLV
jgi:hypothetical protein